MSFAVCLHVLDFRCHLGMWAAPRPVESELLGMYVPHGTRGACPLCGLPQCTEDAPAVVRCSAPRYPCLHIPIGAAQIGCGQWSRVPRGPEHISRRVESACHALPTERESCVSSTCPAPCHDPPPPPLSSGLQCLEPDPVSSGALNWARLGQIGVVVTACQTSNSYKRVHEHRPPSVVQQRPPNQTRRLHRHADGAQ